MGQAQSTTSSASDDLRPLNRIHIKLHTRDSNFDAVHRPVIVATTMATASLDIDIEALHLRVGDIDSQEVLRVCRRVLRSAVRVSRTTREISERVVSVSRVACDAIRYDADKERPRVQGRDVKLVVVYTDGVDEMQQVVRSVNQSLAPRGGMTQTAAEGEVNGVRVTVAANWKDTDELLMSYKRTAQLVSTLAECRDICTDQQMRQQLGEAPEKPGSSSPLESLRDTASATLEQARPYMALASTLMQSVNAGGGGGGGRKRKKGRKGGGDDEDTSLADILKLGASLISSASPKS